MLYTFGFGGDGRLGAGKPPPRQRRGSLNSGLGSRQPRRTRRLSIEQSKKQEEEQTSPPTRVTLPDVDGDGTAVAVVVCGTRQTAAVTSSGSLYMWGRGKDGRLGVETDADTAIPTRVLGALAAQRVIAVATGTRHTLAVTASGACYAWGKGRNHQLGTNDTATYDTPKLVMEAFFKEHGPAVGCAAGTFHSCVFTADGKLYSWGINSCGELGDGTKTAQPQAVAARGLDGVKVVQAVANGSHTLVRGDNGLAYGVGDNSHGQLGVSPSDRSQQTTFQAVHEISGVVWVSTDTKHSAACTRDGTIYAWGASRWEANEDDDEDTAAGVSGATHVPVQIKALAEEQIVQVAAGGQTTLALSDRGVVWGWGDDVVPRPVGVNGVAMYVAAGTRHCGVILSNKHASVRKGLTLDEAEADERKTRS